MNLYEETMKFAEVLNALRVIPRMLLVTYGMLVWEVTDWLMGLQEPSMAQAGVLASIIGISGVVISSYNNTGGKK